MADDIRNAMLATARRLGIDPVDLGTVISYETAGTFDPWKAGPTTQYGQHRGLIQWGEPQRAQYGVSEGMPVAAQMDAVAKYLTDAGVRPGMGLLDVYSAVNAGRVGRYGASDANNGGAPGTVRDKVETQMAGHRAKAAKLLGGEAAPAMAPPREVVDRPIAGLQPEPTATPRPETGGIGAIFANFGSGMGGGVPESGGLATPQAPMMAGGDPSALLGAATGLVGRAKGLRNALGPDVEGLMGLGKRV